MNPSRSPRLVAAAIVLSAATLAAQSRPPGQEISTPQIAPPAADVAAALQRKYDALKDFSASFTQTYQGGVLRRNAAPERGTVRVKKPGMMRWDYTSPEKKLFISDGRTMFMYFPADRQVMKNPVPERDEATSAVMFLMGKGDITRDFNVRWSDGNTGEGPYRLRLDPKTRQTEYDWLEVAADRETLQIVGLTAADAQGGRSTFSFSNFKENTGLADKIFQFSIPRGTEVISSGKTP